MDMYLPSDYLSQIHDTQERSTKKVAETKPNPNKRRKLNTDIGVKYSDDQLQTENRDLHETEKDEQKKTEVYRIRLYAFCKECEQVKGYFPDKQKTEEDVIDINSGKKKRSRDGKIIKQYSSLGFERGKTPDMIPLAEINMDKFPKRICNACRFKKTSAVRANPYRQLLQSGSMNRVVSTTLQKKEVTSNPSKFHRPDMICGFTVPDPSRLVSDVTRPIQVMTDTRMYSPGEMITGLPFRRECREKKICDTVINGWMSDYCIVDNCTRKASQYGYCKICWSKSD